MLGFRVEGHIVSILLHRSERYFYLFYHNFINISVLPQRQKKKLKQSVTFNRLSFTESNAKNSLGENSAAL